jgi:hypothetical protein
MVLTRKDFERMGAGVMAVLMCGLAGSQLACDPPHWRFTGALTLPPALPALPQGNAVAIATDVAAVGKPGTSPAVDIFTRSGDAWTSTQRLHPRPGAAPGSFGIAVALDQFGSQTLAIGASNNDAAGVQNGYVDIYVSSGGPWTYLQTVTPSGWTPPPGSGCPVPTEFSFGARLDIYRDTLVVGAPRFCDGIGRVFVFQRTGTTFAQVAELKEADAVQRGDANFGDAIAAGDGIAVIGRPDTGALTSLPKFGKVYIYAPAAGGIPAILQSSTATTAYDGFGLAVAMTSNGNRLAVRAATTLQYFTRAGTAWTAVWSTPVQTAGNGSVALSLSYLVIGEPSSGGFAGEVDIFPSAGSTFGAPWVRSEPAPAANHYFGSTVALFMDELLVGAPGTATYSATLSFRDGPY